MEKNPCYSIFVLKDCSPWEMNHAEAQEIFENDGAVGGKSYRLRTISIPLRLCIALVEGCRKVRNEEMKLNLGIRGVGE